MAARDQHPPSTTSPLPVRRRRALVTALAIATAVAAPTAFAAAAGTGIEAVASVSTTGSSADDRFEAQGAADAVLFRPETTTSTSTSAPPATAPTIAPTAPPPPPPPPPPAPPAPPTTQASSYGDPADPATWDRLSQCEAGGNWAANTGNGYYGGLQFSLSSWQAVGGTGYPHQHSRETQIEMGRRLYASQGWDAWPACSRELGYR